MPFKSEKQRRFMWMKHPEIAEKWAHEGGESTGKESKEQKTRKHLMKKMSKHGGK